MSSIASYALIVLMSVYSTGLVALNWWCLLRGCRIGADARYFMGRAKDRGVPAGRIVPVRSSEKPPRRGTVVFQLDRPTPITFRLRSAFTLVELLVVVGIIAILIGILLPALSGVRKAAQHTRLSAGLREVMLGYTQYHIDNKGSLLFGYTPPTVNGAPVVVNDPVSGHTFGMPVADRYPWRLVPYVSNIWGVMHIHADTPPRPQAGDSPSDALMKAYALSINPSFGINSVYVGGHAGPIFQGFGGPSGDRPNTGNHVAFKAGQVRRPSQQIVFAECVARNAPFGDPDTGLHFVMPTRANGQRWKVVNGEFQITSGMITGIPKGRFGNRAAVAFFDGHVESLMPGELEDMRLWAPRATAPDYDFVP